MTNILLGIWFILFGVLHLVPTKVPEWIVPLCAVVLGLIILAGGVQTWRKAA